MTAFRAARRVLLDAAAARVFPCAVVEVGDRVGCAVARGVRPAHLRRDRAGSLRRDDLRPGVSHEGARHDPARHADGGRRAPRASTGVSQTSCRRGSARTAATSGCRTCWRTPRGCPPTGRSTRPARGGLPTTPPSPPSRSSTRRAREASTATSGSSRSASCSRTLAGETARRPVRPPPAAWWSRSERAVTGGRPSLEIAFAPARVGRAPGGADARRGREAWRGARRERGGARRRGRPRGPVRNGRRGRGDRPLRAAIGGRDDDGRRAGQRRLPPPGSCRRPASPAARARWGGTRCCRPRRAARACLRAPSATRDIPAHRCGSIRTRGSTWCC